MFIRLTCRRRWRLTHVHCRGPILHRGSTQSPSSAGSPPPDERPSWECRQVWSLLPARRHRSEPRFPPPRTQPSSAGGSGGKHPEREQHHSEHINKCGGGEGGTLLRVGQRFKYVHTQLQWDKNRLLKLWTTAPHWPKVTWFMGYSVGLFVHDWLRLTVFKTLVLLSKCAEKPAGLQRDRHVQRVQHVKVQHVITGKAKQWWTKVIGTYILISVHVCTVVKHTYKHLRECKSDHQHSKWRDWSNLLSLKPFNVRYNGCLTKYKVVVDFTERSFLSLLLPYSIFKLILSYIIFDIHRFDRHRCYPMNDQLLLLEFPDPSSVTSTCPWCILKPLPPARSSWIAHPAASASTARWLRSVAANRRNRRPPTAARLRLTGASSQRRELSTAHLGSARPGWSVGVFAKARRNRRNALNFKIRRQTLGLHPFHCSDGGNRLI